jgi:hypothetical protein
MSSRRENGRKQESRTKPSRKKSFKVNDFIFCGIATPTQMNVTPSNQLIKKSELPPQYHRILEEAAGHCRSKKESACVRKLLEAVRISHEVNEKFQKSAFDEEANEEESIYTQTDGAADDILGETASQGSALRRLYADSPRGLAASHSFSESSVRSGSIEECEPEATTPLSSSLINYDKFVDMLGNKVPRAIIDMLIKSEGLDLSVFNQLDEVIRIESERGYQDAGGSVGTSSDDMSDENKYRMKPTEGQDEPVSPVKSSLKTVEVVLMRSA